MGKTIGGQAGSGPNKTIRGAAGSGPQSSNSSNQSGGDCFVATAAFGTPLAEEINILRKYRDTELRYSELGRKFISFYYTYGPYVARILRKYPTLKKPVRGFIKGIIIFMQR